MTHETLKLHYSLSVYVSYDYTIQYPHERVLLFHNGDGRDFLFLLFVIFMFVNYAVKKLSKINSSISGASYVYIIS